MINHLECKYFIFPISDQLHWLVEQNILVHNVQHSFLQFLKILWNEQPGIFSKYCNVYFMFSWMKICVKNNNAHSILVVKTPFYKQFYFWIDRCLSFKWINLSWEGNRCEIGKWAYTITSMSTQALTSYTNKESVFTAGFRQLSDHFTADQQGAIGNPKAPARSLCTLHRLDARPTIGSLVMLPLCILFSTGNHSVLSTHPQAETGQQLWVHILHQKATYTDPFLCSIL